MKGLTKKTLIFIFAVAIVFCGICLITGYSKDAGVKDQAGQAGSSLNAPLGSYSVNGTNSWQHASNMEPYANNSEANAGTIGNPYKIANAKQLAYMAFQINSNQNTEAYFELIDDINLSAYYWIPIGMTPVGTSNYTNVFKGNFNGGNYTIYGMYVGNPNSTPVVSSSLAYAGLFGYANANARIQNLNLECFIQNTGTYIGGIVGYADNITLNKCKVILGSKIYSAITATGYQIGGMVGRNAGNISFNYCFNYAEIKTSGSASYSVRTGGLIGQGSNVTMDRSGNFGDIRASSSIAIGGLIAYTGGVLKMETCFNEGDLIFISSSASYSDTGGLVGWASTTSCTITNCYNIGNIYMQTNPSTPGSTGVGGLVGWGGLGTIKGCFVSGSIIVNGTVSSVGALYGNSSPTVNNCYYDSESDLRYLGATIDNPSSGSEITRVTPGIITTSVTGKNMDYNKFPTAQDFVDALNTGNTGIQWILGSNGLPTLDIEGIFSNEASITFDYNYQGANPAVKEVTKALGQNILASDIEMPNRTAYDFTKWTESQNGNSLVWYEYDNGNFVEKNSLGLTLNNPVSINTLSGKTLYAQWDAIQYRIVVENTINRPETIYNATFEDSDTTISADEISAGAAAFFSFKNWEVWDSADNGGIDDYVINYSLGETFNLNAILTLEFINDNAYLDIVSGEMTIKFKAVFTDENTNLYRLTIKSNYQSYGSVKIDGTAIPYNVSVIKEENDSINLTAVENLHYDFVSFNIDGNIVENLTTTFSITKDTDIYVIFARHEYDISISSQYDTGVSITQMAFIGGQSAIKGRIGDIIRVTYKTNVPGFRFASIKLSDIELDRSGLGVYEFEITPEMLAYLNVNELKLIAEYSRQYSFSINFGSSTNDQYYVLNAFYGDDESPIFANSTYFLDFGMSVTIKLMLVSGYEVSSISGLEGYSIDDLLRGIDFPSIDSAWYITIDVVPIEHDVSLQAKWEEVTINEIGFSTGRDFTLEYNGRTDAIIKYDVPRYRFDGWYIRHWESNTLIKISDEYVDNGNLKPLTYQYLKDSGYISDELKIEIVASYVPVYKLTVNVAGFWSYEVKVNNEVKDSFKTGQFDHGTKFIITVKNSNYIDIKFTLNGNPLTLQDILTNGFYVLERTLNNIDYIIDLDFEEIAKTLNLAENISGAKGSYKLTGGERNGNKLDVKYNKALTFTFEAASAQKLNEWTIKGVTVMTADELVERGWATRSGNNLTLHLNTEEALDWLTGSSEITVTIGTIFNPLFTALIAVGGVLIVALAIFIALYAVAANNKKKKIKAAVEAGIIGAARFKTNFHENI